MKELKLIYWHTDIDNYGDLLSPYIISKLSGAKIIHKNFFVGNLKSHIYHFIQSIKNKDWKFTDSYLLPLEKAIIGIGSVLNWGNKLTRIWGAGFMSNDEKCKGGKIYAIRGYLSLNKIKSQIKNGDKICIIDNVAIGDPALLLPIILKPSKIKKNKIGIIPHFSEVEDFKKKYEKRFHIIDLRSSDIEKITNDITSCEYILSTSLHGLIIAHAYAIPALWMEYTGLEIGTKGFKFNDYFSSVGIDSYQPIRDIEGLLESEEKIINTMEQYGDKVYAKNIENIQRQLIKKASFKVQKEYIKV